MKACRRLFLIATVLTVTAFAKPKDDKNKGKGFCPPPPPKVEMTQPKKDVAKPADCPGKTFVGSIAFATVISDTGFVCSAQVVRGVDSTVDAEALNAFRKLHFDAAKKDGHAVPVTTVIDIDFWRDKDGQLTSCETPTDAQGVDKTSH